MPGFSQKFGSSKPMIASGLGTSKAGNIGFAKSSAKYPNKRGAGSHMQTKEPAHK